MLFNSYEFLCVFLPLAVAIYAIADQYPSARAPALILLSLAFYSYWDIRLLPVMLGSILGNWLAARAYLQTKRPAILTLAIVANVAVLGLFKYTDFLADNLAYVLGTSIPHLELALPLGISFFTFTHISYLVDLQRAKASICSLERYALYICFFPKVASGPIARPNEIVHQFGQRAFGPGWERRCALAVTFIIVGLLQKTILADQMARGIDPVYAQAAMGPVPDGKSWLALLYPFQLFFDFSGYTDVAIGVALIFGIELPRNFDRPFRATSITEFWRRWHISLSTWLRDYIFSPIALELRHWGVTGIVASLMITFLICGLWHGASWTFVAWGALHGMALGFAVLWGRYLPSPPRLVGWAATVGFVTFAIVFFRAESFEAALRIFQGLATLPTNSHPEGRNAMAAAVVCALALPASHEICRRLAESPRLYVAVGLAVAACFIIASIGSRESYQFAYFQF